MSTAATSKLQQRVSAVRAIAANAFSVLVDLAVMAAALVVLYRAVLPEPNSPDWILVLGAFGFLGLGSAVTRPLLRAVSRDYTPGRRAIGEITASVAAVVYMNVVASAHPVRATALAGGWMFYWMARFGQLSLDAAGARGRFPSSPLLTLWILLVGTAWLWLVTAYQFGYVPSEHAAYALQVNVIHVFWVGVITCAFVFAFMKTFLTTPRTDPVDT